MKKNESGRIIVRRRQHRPQAAVFVTATGDTIRLWKTPVADAETNDIAIDTTHTHGLGRQWHFNRDRPIRIRMRDARIITENLDGGLSFENHRNAIVPVHPVIVNG